MKTYTWEEFLVELGKHGKDPNWFFECKLYPVVNSNLYDLEYSTWLPKDHVSKGQFWRNDHYSGIPQCFEQLNGCTVIYNDLEYLFTYNKKKTTTRFELI